MLQIGNKIIGLDVLRKKFVCDVEKCKGACCVQGDSGAPLEDDEVDILQDILPDVKPFMLNEGIEAIDKNGFFYVDSDGDKVTMLINGKACAFAIYENGIARCSIEKAWMEGKIKFQKPVSCHLYPLRVKKYRQFTAVNYDRWELCKPALKKGAAENVPLYIFVNKALQRRFGAEFAKEISLAGEEYERTGFK